MKRQRPYDDECRATCLACLAANAGNLKRTARQCGVPVNTLRSWRDGSGAVPQRARALAAGVRPAVGRRLDRWTHTFLDVVLRKVDECDAYKAAMIAFRCTDA